MFNSRLISVGIVALALPIAACSPSAQFPQFSPALFAPEPATKTAALETDDQTPPADLLSYAAPANTAAPEITVDRARINRLITKYANEYSVPESLVHSVVRRESTYNPNARNGIHVGLMQLNPATARTMGYKGSNAGLYDPEQNLKYGVKYLAGAYLVADGNAARADKLYQSGYYYHAKRRGMLKVTGLRP